MDASDASDWFVGGLVGRVVGWLADWLLGWLVDCVGWIGESLHRRLALRS